MMWLGLALVLGPLAIGWWAAGGFTTPHNPTLDNQQGDPR